eukprot:SAG31_NODE_603_length_13622_cov_19.019953_14_plen_100_part_00
MDSKTDTIFLIPNTTAAAQGPLELSFIAPRVKTLVSIRGAAEDPSGGLDGAAMNITLKGLTFAYSAPSYLEPYVVPSPGDVSAYNVASYPATRMQAGFS